MYLFNTVCQNSTILKLVCTGAMQFISSIYWMPLTFMNAHSPVPSSFFPKPYKMLHLPHFPHCVSAKLLKYSLKHICSKTSINIWSQIWIVLPSYVKNGEEEFSLTGAVVFLCSVRLNLGTIYQIDIKYAKIIIKLIAV